MEADCSSVAAEIVCVSSAALRDSLSMLSADSTTRFVPVSNMVVDFSISSMPLPIYVIIVKMWSKLSPALLANSRPD